VAKAKKKNKSNKLAIIALVLFCLAALLELTTLVIAFTLGHPYVSNTCPFPATILNVCFYLGMSAIIANIASFIVSSISTRKNFAFPASIVLFVIMLLLAWPILVQSGWGINWCNWTF